MRVKCVSLLQCKHPRGCQWISSGLKTATRGARGCLGTPLVYHPETLLPCDALATTVPTSKERANRGLEIDAPAV
jgi:hypothetical protein